MNPNVVGRDSWAGPSPNPAFTAAIIGETSLAVQCAEILLGKGHPICSVVSHDPQLVRWARTREIPEAPPSAAVADFLGRRPFDHLFVIICHSVLGSEVLALPRQLAINYHDGPLPRYAGVNATSWAILNHEACHGVTWHCMSEHVDAGPILVQHAVAIAPHDTALTLNLKCYQAGIQAFRELVDGLAEGTLHPTPQDLGLRTYFRRSKRPPAACLLDWTRPAKELSALVRSLSMGDYPNSLGTPKASIGRDLVAVGQLEVLGGSGAPTGTVTGIDETSIMIAVADGDVALRGLRTLEGRPLRMGELAERHGLARGSRLSLLDVPTATALGELHARLAPHEAFWIEQLTGVAPLTLPHKHPTPSNGVGTYVHTTCEVPPTVRHTLRSLVDGGAEADVLLAAVTVYLARLARRRRFHLGLSREPLTGPLAPFDSLLAQPLPLHVEIDPEEPFARTCEMVGEKMRVAREHGGFLRDLRQREPRVREHTGAFPIVLGVGTGDDDPPPGTDLAISVSADGARLVWIHRVAVLDEEDVARVQRQLTTFLAGLTAHPDRPVRELQLLGEAEGRGVLVEWNDTATDVASDRCERERSASAPYVAPRTEAEARLAEIWAQVLRLERVGVEDNFFELGGDSIQCILIVTRAGQAGLRLFPWQLFEHQTVAGLAAVAEVAPEVVAEQQVVEGEVALTPIQSWFCEQQLDEWHHFNQSAWVEMPAEVDRLALRAALAAVVAHHDALRLRLERARMGWTQHIVSTEEAERLWWVDLSQVEGAERRSVIEAHAARLQASLDLEAGPLLRAALFTGPAREPSWLLIAVHHLAMDGVSWQILLEDLRSACEQLRAGQEVRLPAKTTSYQEWARRLHEHARSEALATEAPYWLDERRREAVRLPVDHAGAENSVCSSAQVWMSLDEEETRRLLQEVPSAYRTQINDALLAALAQVLSRWAGGGPLLVDLEGHGREELFEGVDLGRTVGWFTTIAPVLLEVEDEGADPGRWLRSVKEQLRRMPRKGIGHGLLRYLSGDAAVEEGLMRQPGAEVSLNYLGQFGGRSGWMPLGTRGLPTGPQRSGVGRRAHLVEIEAAVEDGRLRACWTYSQAVHEEGTVNELAQGFAGALRELIAHCCSPEAGGLTPSDVALAGLDQAMLDRLLG
jgi:non-ribosomal peptide synthase protein (TIGR01720 family)